MANHPVTQFPCTVTVPTGAQVIYCNTAGKKFRMEIPNMMFSGTVWLRFYEPYTTQTKPSGYSTKTGKTYEIAKLAGPSPARGYNFKFEAQISGSQTNVDMAQSVDDSDPGNWIPATDRNGLKWVNQSTCMGGRWSVFCCYASFRK